MIFFYLTFILYLCVEICNVNVEHGRNTLSQKLFELYNIAQSVLVLSNIQYRGTPTEPGTTKPRTTRPGTTKPGTTKPGTTFSECDKAQKATKPGTTEPRKQHCECGKFCNAKEPGILGTLQKL
jgi:hypothetical protein